MDGVRGQERREKRSFSFGSITVHMEEERGRAVSVKDDVYC